MRLFRGMQTERLVQDLLSHREPNAEKIKELSEKLLKGGGKAVPKIIDGLAGADKQQTVILVDILTKLVSEATLPLYTEHFDTDDSKILSGVAWALSSSKNYNPNRLVDLLDDGGTPKGPILQVISVHQDNVDTRKLLAKAYELNADNKELVMRIVGEQADERLVPELISRVSGKDPLVRVHIIKVLENFESPEVQMALQNQLRDKSKLVRQAALSALGRMAEKIDIRILCKLLLDPEVDVQNKAVDVIIRVNHPDTVKYLIEPLKDENEYSRRSAVEILNAIGDDKSIKFLFSALKDDDWWVRSRATDALASIGGDRVLAAVMKLIQDKDDGVRRAAIEILNVTKDARSLGHLAKATQDSDWWVRERAADALGDMGDTRAVPALTNMLKSSPKSMPAALKALTKLSASPAINNILPLVEHESIEVKVEAINALAKLAEEKHVDLVTQVLSTVKESNIPEVREACLTALAELNDRFSATIIAENKKAEKLAEPGHTLLMDGSKVQNIISEHKANEVLDIGNIKEGDLIENRYKFLQHIGKGAFGTVLLVEDTVVEEQLVLKFLNRAIADDEEMMQRFVHELRYSRKITHRNVIRIYDFLFLQGLYAISMEYFPSHTLSHEIPDNQPLPPDLALKIGRDIATGMSVAHHVGIVHRDLKPANVLINEDRLVKVVDFGVAAAQRSGDTQLTKTGYVIGSPKYMAPEQILGKPVDERSDIYSLGIILYELLCGHPPYSKGDHMAVMYQHVQGKAESLKKMNPALDQAIVDVVEKAISVDKLERWQTMDDIKLEIEKLLK